MRRRYEFETDETKNNDDINLDTFRRNKSSIHSVQYYVGLIVLIFLLGLYGISYTLDNILPTPLTLSDEVDHPDSFISERAEYDLKLLTNMGPRIAGGYQNEILAVDFLVREINFIIQQKHKNQLIELDQQIVSGNYYSTYENVGKYNVFSNVQNIVVKLHSKNKSNHSVLVNSHYDSVPTSPGATDDGINVVAMLEILRKLSRSSERPQHNIIFLFNGAEETPLQASHGFITQHKWAKECVVIVNLEACGVGGKIILFQSGPQRPWLMKYYNSVPYPYAQAAGEEIFQSGIIPSDTDFRIFRDYGDMVGYDMAFFKNGYRYHTKYDDFSSIPMGSLQHVGDNALALIKSLSNAPELSSPNEEIAKVVFFDIFGLFMISYNTTVAVILNIIAVILSIAVFIVSFLDFRLGMTKVTLKYLAVTLGAIILGWICAVVFVLLTAFIVDALNFSMSWYNKPWILFGLYAAPTVLLSGIFLFLINHENLSLNLRCQIQTHLVRLIWTLVLLVGTILGIRSMYAILIPVIFNAISFTVIHGFRLHHSIRIWQIIYILGLIIPTMLLMYQTNTTLSLFVPITGRFGSHKNPEIVIGILTTVFTILITSPYVALVTLMRNAKLFCAALAVLFIAALIIILTPLGFPYSGEHQSATPQRYWIMHTSRTVYDENFNINKTESGVFMLNMDRNSPKSLKNYLKDYKKIRPLEADCKNYVICGLPLSHVRMMEIMQYSTWIPAVQPVIHEKTQFSVLAKEQINPTTIRYNVSVSGPDRVGLYLVPKTGIRIENISIDSPISYGHDARDIYFIQHNYGKDPASLKLTFDVITPENWNQTSVDLAVTAQHVHEKVFVKTPFYENFIKQFPDWADVTAWLGTYSAYVL